MNQAFTPKELLRQLHRTDLNNWNTTKNLLQLQLDGVTEAIVASTFELDIRKINDYYLANNLPQSLVLRKLNDNIKRIYKDKQANRNLIIDQMITLLIETTPFYILRTDISKFYESIDRNYLISKIRNDSMVSYQSFWLLSQIFDHPLLKNTTGLPRGMNISATLSELHMRDIDRWIIRNPQVYYYARFVDDIVVFAFKESFLEGFKDDLKIRLDSIGLKLNKSKTDQFNGNQIGKDKPLQYLGYKFWIGQSEKAKILNISIADKKIKKTKTRIVLALLDFIKNGDFNLLNMRVKFLTGNFVIKKGEDCSDLKAGIYYNYPHLTDEFVLKDLDSFLRTIINSRRNSFGRKISAALSKSQRTSIGKYSFHFGYHKRITNCFAYDDLVKIEKCWL
jgi:hypothetical protein